MIKFAKIIDKKTGLCEIALGTDEEFYKSIGMEKLDVDQSDIDYYWYLFDKCPHKSEEEKKREEKERIGNLTCTKRVFILLLEELGLDYFEQIEPLINANRQARLEWELASTLLRSNPLINNFAIKLGITEHQIDILFEVANNEKNIEELKSTVKN